MIKGLLKIAIDLESWFYQNQGLQNQNRAQAWQGTDGTARGSKRHARSPSMAAAPAAFWARACPLAHLFPCGYKYPPGVSKQKYTELGVVFISML